MSGMKCWWDFRDQWDVFRWKGLLSGALQLLIQSRVWGGLAKSADSGAGLSGIAVSSWAFFLAVNGANSSYLPPRDVLRIKWLNSHRVWPGTGVALLPLSLSTSPLCESPFSSSWIGEDFIYSYLSPCTLCSVLFLGYTRQTSPVSILH